jgi:hypothetical protein
VVTTKGRDLRFEEPLYTVAEAAAYGRVPRTTFETWAHGYTRKRIGRRTTKASPIVASVRAGRREPEIPFIGLAEGMVLAAFRSSGVPMQRIRPAVEVLKDELGPKSSMTTRSKKMSQSCSVSLWYEPASGSSLPSSRTTCSGSRMRRMDGHSVCVSQYPRT